MVVGTGDMSEIAQGWCTFNGDHMSMYNPNAGVPKTLVRTLVQWYADHRATQETKAILHDILDTPVSPELTGNGDLSQTTEDLIGPYELLDFFNKEERRYGSRPQKIGYLACRAFKDRYDEATIAQWLQSYFGRFTASQWKRESMPNGPKIGTVSLSPRTDLRMAPNTSKTWYQDK
jgi:NAD+ synthase (glutamine-hydrolysing)